MYSIFNPGKKEIIIATGFIELEIGIFISHSFSFVHEEHQKMPLTPTNMVDLSCK